MAAISTSELFEEAKCYLCLGITIAEALELALLARVAGGSSGGSSAPALVIDNIDLTIALNSFPHGLSTVPSRVELVWKGNMVPQGYVAGSEINNESVFNGTNTLQPLVVVDRDATNVSVSRSVGDIATTLSRPTGVIFNMLGSQQIGKLRVWT